MLVQLSIYSLEIYSAESSERFFLYGRVEIFDKRWISLIIHLSDYKSPGKCVFERLESFHVNFWWLASKLLIE